MSEFLVEWKASLVFLAHRAGRRFQNNYGWMSSSFNFFIPSWWIHTQCFESYVKLFDNAPSCYNGVMWRHRHCEVTVQKCFPSVLTASYTSSSYYKNVKRDHALNELLYKVKNLIRCSNGKNTVFWLTQKQRKTKNKKNSVWVTVIFIDKTSLFCFDVWRRCITFSFMKQSFSTYVIVVFLPVHLHNPEIMK